MKRFIIALFFATLCLACQQQVEEEIAPVLDFSTDVVSVANTGGSSSFEINANNDWTAEVGGSESWFSIDKTSGTSGSATVNVTVDECTSHRPRIGCVIVRSAGLVKQVSIAQVPAPNTDKIEVNPAELEFTYAAASKDITLTANVDWTASVDADWITLSVTSGKSSSSAVTVKATVSENSGKSNREAVITIEGGDAPKVEIPVFQEAFESIILNPASLAFEFSGGKETISVEANVDWTAVSSASWLKIDKSSGTKNVSATVTVTAEANAADSGREATITFKGGSTAQEVVKVSQKSHSLTITLLASWRADDASYTESHSPDWSTAGSNAYSNGTGKGIAIPEESGSAARLVWHFESAKTPTFITAAEGHYAVKHFDTNDGYEYSIPVPASGIYANTVIRYQAGFQGVATCPKYWAVIYSLDGGANWEYADTGTEFNTTKNGFKYSLQLPAAKTTVNVNASFTVTDNMQEGSVLLIRHMCADGGIQTSGNTKPGTNATVRNCPFTDKDGNSQAGPMITMEY